MSVWRSFNREYANRSMAVDMEYANQKAANIFCPGFSYHYIIDFSNPKDFFYLSPSVENVLSVSRMQFTLSNMLDRIHPKEVKHVVRCEELINEMMFKKLQLDQLTQYKFTYNFRIRHEDGSYRLILHQAMVVSQDGFGRPSHVLSVDTVIDHLISSNNYSLSVIGFDGAPSYLGIKVSQPHYLVLSSSFEQLFSERELEIIRRFAEGHTANTVAALLNISNGTVRTHRQNVLKKSGCPNMTGLVAKCIREGLI